MASRMRKKDRNAMTVFIHFHCPMPTNAPTSEHIHSESGLGKHVDRSIYIIESRIESLSEKDLTQLEIYRKTMNTMCLKCHSMKILLKVEKWQSLKKMVFTSIFYSYFIDP